MPDTGSLTGFHKQRAGQTASYPAIKASRINLTVCGVLFIFAYVYSTVVACVIVPWLSFSVPGALNLLFITVNTSLALYCFLLCVVVDPGSVPHGYEPELEAGHKVVQVKKKSGEKRFCQKCGHHKPPRTHHCRICRRCVLRMDHHCPWINNCVGFGNYKAFLLFLLYVNAAIGHALGLLLAHAVHALRLAGDDRLHALRSGPTAAAPLHASILWTFLQTVCTAVTAVLTLGLVILLGWNAYLVMHNMTTIEYHEGVTAHILALQRGTAEARHPYDVGLCGNLAEICDAGPHTWLLPTHAAAAGDGIAFASAWDRCDAGLALL